MQRSRPVGIGSRRDLGHTPQCGCKAVRHIHAHRHRSLTGLLGKAFDCSQVVQQQDSVYGGLR